jgi:hypothetical protein
MGLATRPATSASGGQAVRELLCLVRITLQGFELLALPAGATTAPRSPRWTGGPPLAGACCCGPLEACTGGYCGWPPAAPAAARRCASCCT